MSNQLPFKPVIQPKQNNMGALPAIAAGLTSVGGGVIGMIGQRRRDERAMANQRQLMSIQHKNQQELNKQGHELQKEMWEHTNYKNQVKMLKEAGLNPALLYGMGGQGGATVGSQTGGQAAAGQAPSPQHMDINTIASAINSAADVKLKEALAKKAEAEANKTAGVDTSVAEITAESIKEGINNLKAQQALMQAHTVTQDLENQLKGESLDDQLQTLKWAAKKVEYEAGKAKAEKDVSTATVNTKIDLLNAELAYIWIKTKAEESNIKVNDAEIRKMATEIEQKWKALSLEAEKTNQGWQNIDISKFEAEIKANYPTIWEAFGSSMDNVIKGISQLMGGRKKTWEVK